MVSVFLRIVVILTELNSLVNHCVQTPFCTGLSLYIVVTLIR